MARKVKNPTAWADEMVEAALFIHIDSADLELPLPPSEGLKDSVEQLSGIIEILRKSLYGESLNEYFAQTEWFKSAFEGHNLDAICDRFVALAEKYIDGVDMSATEQYELLWTAYRIALGGLESKLSALGKRVT